MNWLIVGSSRCPFVEKGVPKLEFEVFIKLSTADSTNEVLQINCLNIWILGVLELDEQITVVAFNYEIDGLHAVAQAMAGIVKLPCSNCANDREL